MNKNHILKINLLSLFLVASCTTPVTIPATSSKPTVTPSVNPSVTPNPSQSPDSQSSVSPNVSPTPNVTVSSGVVVNTNTTLSLPSDFLKLSYNDYYSADLKWSQMTGAKSYKLFQDGKLIADNLTGSTYKVNNLRPNTDYSFDIVAINDAGESNKSTIKMRTFIPSSNSSSNNNNNNYYPNINPTPYVNTNPVIYSLSASRGLVNDEITIKGANFSTSAPLNIVKFGNIIATVVSASSTQLKVTVPSGLGSQPVSVTVGSITTNSLPFTIIGISSVSDNTRKVNQTITVNGAGFTGITSAKVGNTNVTDLVIVSDTELSFTVPSTGTRGIQIITLSNGTQTFTNNDLGTTDDLNILNRIVYVNISNNGTKDGKSWNSAYDKLQTALTDNTVLADDEIWVAQGVYKPDTTNRESTFTLKNGVNLFGGFTVGATSINSRNYTNTILSGDIGTVNDKSDNSYHVVTGISGDTVSIDGFVISDGNANGSDPSDRGAGIYNKADLTVMNSTVKSNVASSDGGGILNNGTLTVGGTSIIENNTAKAGGGLLNGQNNTMTIGGTTIIRKNKANQGGGIFNYQGTEVNLNDSASITDNTANLPDPNSNPRLNLGGGIFSTGSTININDNSYISGNSALRGGGVGNYYGTININNNSYISDNSAYNLGGGIYNGQAGTINISNGSYISYNSASDQGGGVYNYYGTGIFGSVVNIKNNSPDNRIDFYGY